MIDHIGAGSVSEKILGQNEAVRIMTGAQIPEGADAVVMFEQTVEDGDTFTIRKSFEANENVSLKGEETTTGDIVLKKVKSLIRCNSRSCNIWLPKVPVTQRPSIAVIATGSELLDVDDELQPGKIRNSNGPMIKALSEKAGLNVEAYIKFNKMICKVVFQLSKMPCQNMTS